MSDGETFQIGFKFTWPAELESSTYDAGDEAEWEISFRSAGPVPLVGEEILFDHPDDESVRDDIPPGPSGRRFLVGVVESRLFTVQESRYGSRSSRYWTVELRLKDIRLWEPS